MIIAQVVDYYLPTSTPYKSRRLAVNLQFFPTRARLIFHFPWLYLLGIEKESLGRTDSCLRKGLIAHWQEMNITELDQNPL